MAVDLHAGPPDTRGWGSGWPHCQTEDIIPLILNGVTFRSHDYDPVRGFHSTSFSGGIHKGVHELATLLLLATVERGYKLHDGWCWGYACRAIKGLLPPVASNHSWGLALDINAPLNPMGDQLITDMPIWMPDLWNDYGWRWGGDYDGRKDAMHYEFMGTPNDSKELTVKAGKELEVGLTDTQKDNLTYIAGFRLRFEQETPNEPDQPGPKRQGWRHADKLLAVKP